LWFSVCLTDNGKTCTLWLRVNDDTLRVRGYIGPFYRTQTWYARNDRPTEPGALVLAAVD
jgi:hypothetical protein